MAFVAGTDLSLTVPLIDASGAAFNAVSIEYKLFDGDGNTLVESAALTSYTPASAEATVTIEAQFNQLPADSSKAARELELLCLRVDGSKTIATKIYFIEASSGTLIRGSNTLVTLAGAEMLASDMLNLDGWNAANRQDKTSALVEAYRRLGKLSLTPINGCDDVFISGGASKCYRFSGTGLPDLTVSQVLSLDSRMLAALALAQVAEANSILDSDPVTSKRREGLLLDAIGDVKQMYKSGKPLELPVSRRALDYIGAYTNLGSKPLGRK